MADQGLTADSNFYAGRKAFPSEGVPWHPSGDGDGDGARKRAQRCLASLITGGLVCRFPSGVALTPKGDSYTRSLVGLPSLLESYTGAAAVLHHAGDAWASECVLILNSRTATYDDLGPRAGKLLAANDAAYLPALSRGHVVSNSDADGRLFFKLSEFGLQWLAGGVPGRPVDQPPADEKALGHYITVRTARREHLRSQTPINPAEVGPCPLPVSGGPIRTANGIDDPPRRRRKKKVPDG